jgi:hypothetical protein
MTVTDSEPGAAATLTRDVERFDMNRHQVRKTPAAGRASSVIVRTRRSVPCRMPKLKTARHMVEVAASHGARRAMIITFGRIAFDSRSLWPCSLRSMSAAPVAEPERFHVAIDFARAGRVSRSERCVTATRTRRTSSTRPLP